MTVLPAQRRHLLDGPLARSRGSARRGRGWSRCRPPTAARCRAGGGGRTRSRRPLSQHDPVGLATLGQHHAHRFAARSSAPRGRRSRAGSAARAGRDRPAPPASPRAGGRSRPARPSPRGWCARCRARRRPARWSARRSARAARSGRSRAWAGRGTRRRGRARCRPRPASGFASPAADQHVAQPVRQVRAAGAHADEVERPLVLRDALGDLVRHPPQRARDAGGVEQLAPFAEVAVGRWLARRHVRGSTGRRGS